MISLRIILQVIDHQRHSNDSQKTKHILFWVYMGKNATGFAGISKLVSDLNDLNSFNSSNSESNSSDSDTISLDPYQIENSSESTSNNISEISNSNKSKSSNISDDSSQTLSSQEEQKTDNKENIKTNCQIEKNTSTYKLAAALSLILISCFLLYIYNSSNGTSESSKHSTYEGLRSELFQSSEANNIHGHSFNSHLEYSIPLIGTNKIFTIEEIRWCIREKIRIESIRPHISNYIRTSKFNDLVDDYNRRCGEYRYEYNSKAQAEREVEEHRSEIILEALKLLNQFDSYESNLKYSIPVTTPPISNPVKSQAELISEAQRLLAELGYNPGPVDGEFGNKTAKALNCFQSELNITKSNKIDNYLILLLNNTISSYKSSISSNIFSALTEGEYRYLLKNYNDFKDADYKLNQVWKKILNVCDTDKKSSLIKEQNNWLKSGRNYAAENFMKSGLNKKNAYVQSILSRTKFLDALYSNLISTHNSNPNTDVNNIRGQGSLNQFVNKPKISIDKYDNPPSSIEDQSRYNTAKRLHDLGYDIDWRRFSLGEMLDAESRINTARRLHDLGYDIDWHRFSLGDMLDAESRINTARRLHDLGYDIDWHRFSLGDMLDAESRINTARRLKDKGINVNWHNFTLSQLLDMEFKHR